MEKGKYIILKLCLSLASYCLGASIDLENLPAEWDPLLAEVTKPGPVKCEFKEARFNSFHRTPIRFEGRMWWDPQIGLCLYYEKPSQLIINVLAERVLMGHPDEPLQELPESKRQLMVLFSKLFKWETKWLNSNFSIDGEISGSTGWHLSLRPLEEDLSRYLARIDLDGEDGWLERILLDLPAGRTVEIRLSGQSRISRFSDSEIDHAFPGYDE